MLSRLLGKSLSTILLLGFNQFEFFPGSAWPPLVDSSPCGLHVSFGARTWVDVWRLWKLSSQNLGHPVTGVVSMATPSRYSQTVVSKACNAARDKSHLVRSWIFSSARVLSFCFPQVYYYYCCKSNRRSFKRTWRNFVLFKVSQFNHTVSNRIVQMNLVLIKHFTWFKLTWQFKGVLYQIVSWEFPYKRILIFLPNIPDLFFTVSG